MLVTLFLKKNIYFALFNISEGTELYSVSKQQNNRSVTQFVNYALNPCHSALRRCQHSVISLPSSKASWRHPGQCLIYSH